MESLTNLFKNKKESTNTQEKSVQKPEKSQEELRGILESKILSSKLPIQEAIEEYKESLKQGLFDDQEDEEGKGEERKIVMQKKIDNMLARVEKMKAKLDSKEIIPSYTEEIEATYSFTNQDGQVEKTEQITLNLEQKLNEYISFYKTHNVEIPDNFEEDIRDIWEANIDDMEKQIEEHGFNEILLIPPTTDLPDLAEKMKETTYWESDNFKQGGSFKKAQSQNQDKTRIILTHKVQNLKDHPELAKTLNTLGQDVPLDKTLSFEEYLILSKKYFEETLTLSGGQAGKHLDEDGGTWLATKSGARLVYSYWYPSRDERRVGANDFSFRNDALWFRSSCSYMK